MQLVVLVIAAATVCAAKMRDPLSVLKPGLDREQHARDRELMMQKYEELRKAQELRRQQRQQLAIAPTVENEHDARGPARHAGFQAAIALTRAARHFRLPAAAIVLFCTVFQRLAARHATLTAEKAAVLAAEAAAEEAAANAAADEALEAAINELSRLLSSRPRYEKPDSRDATLKLAAELRDKASVLANDIVPLYQQLGIQVHTSIALLAGKRPTIPTQPPHRTASHRIASRRTAPRTPIHTALEVFPLPALRGPQPAHLLAATCTAVVVMMLPRQSGDHNLVDEECYRPEPRVAELMLTMSGAPFAVPPKCERAVYNQGRFGREGRRMLRCAHRVPAPRAGTASGADRRSLWLQREKCPS